MQLHQSGHETPEVSKGFSSTRPVGGLERRRTSAFLMQPEYMGSNALCKHRSTLSSLVKRIAPVLVVLGKLLGDVPEPKDLAARAVRAPQKRTVRVRQVLASRAVLTSIVELSEADTTRPHFALWIYRTAHYISSLQ